MESSRLFFQDFFVLYQRGSSLPGIQITKEFSEVRGSRRSGNKLFDSLFPYRTPCKIRRDLFFRGCRQCATAKPICLTPLKTRSQVQPLYNPDKDIDVDSAGYLATSLDARDVQGREIGVSDVLKEPCHLHMGKRVQHVY